MNRSHEHFIYNWIILLDTNSFVALSFEHFSWISFIALQPYRMAQLPVCADGKNIYLYKNEPSKAFSWLNNKHFCLELNGDAFVALQLNIVWNVCVKIREPKNYAMERKNGKKLFSYVCFDCDGKSLKKRYNWVKALKVCTCDLYSAVSVGFASDFRSWNERLNCNVYMEK